MEYPGSRVLLIRPTIGAMDQILPIFSRRCLAGTAPGSRFPIEKGNRNVPATCRRGPEARLTAPLIPGVSVPG